MGIFLGWIIQKRWLTLVTFGLLIAGAYTLPRLPVPYSYLFVVLPSLLIAATIYEGGRVFGLRIGSRLRLGWALWTGVSVLVLEVGVVLLSGSNTVVFIATIGVFAVMMMAGVLFVARAHAKGLRGGDSH